MQISERQVKKMDKIQVIGVIIYVLLLLVLMNGCAIEPHGCSIGYKVGPEDGCYENVSDKQTGYYWRDHYNHRYSNAPPVPN